MIGAAIVVNALSIVAAQPAMRGGVVLDNVRTVDRVIVAGRWVDASKYREY